MRITIALRPSVIRTEKVPALGVMRHRAVQALTRRVVPIDKWTFIQTTCPFSPGQVVVIYGNVKFVAHWLFLMAFHSTRQIYKPLTLVLLEADFSERELA